MVYVNNKKFACESCIKGHRSSSCHHTDRPLFEIKKKGRPVSQCEKCRELRQSKKMHSKCTCVHQPEPKEPTQPLASSSTSKTRRFIPIVPALPNGLRDVLSQSTCQPADERQTVDSLLNPCNCKSLLKCKCTAAKTPPQHRVIATSLSALASAAAAIQASPPSSSLIESPYMVGKRARTKPKVLTPMGSSCKHHRKDQSSWPHSLHLPLAYSESPSSSGSSHGSLPSSTPNFGIMPPINSLAGTGCTCGVKCSCPGCVEHKEGDRTRKRCGDGCGHCVDPTLELSLPAGPMAAGSSTSSVSNSNNNSKESFLDRFFACAAALPPPPERRRLSIQVNPTDITMYPDNVGPPPMNLPKLECCGARCSCPDGQCSCQKSCVAGSAGDGVEEGQRTVPCERQTVSQSPVLASIGIS